MCSRAFHYLLNDTGANIILSLFFHCTQIAQPICSAGRQSPPPGRTLRLCNASAAPSPESGKQVEPVNNLNVSPQLIETCLKEDCTLWFWLLVLTWMLSELNCSVLINDASCFCLPVTKYDSLTSSPMFSSIQIPVHILLFWILNYRILWDMSLHIFLLCLCGPCRSVLEPDQSPTPCPLSLPLACWKGKTQLHSILPCFGELITHFFHMLNLI